MEEIYRSTQLIHRLNAAACKYRWMQVFNYGIPHEQPNALSQIEFHSDPSETDNIPLKNNDQCDLDIYNSSIDLSRGTENFNLSTITKRQKNRRNISFDSPIFYPLPEQDSENEDINIILKPKRKNGPKRIIDDDDDDGFDAKNPQRQINLCTESLEHSEIRIEKKISYESDNYELNNLFAKFNDLKMNDPNPHEDESSWDEHSDDIDDAAIDDLDDFLVEDDNDDFDNVYDEYDSLSDDGISVNSDISDGENDEPTVFLTAKNREILSTSIYAEYNRRAFINKLPSDLKIVWNKRLLVTAGRANAKKARDSNSANHEYYIEMSVKVCDTENRLRATLAHEMCHLAIWVIDNEWKLPAHGKRFRYWGSKVTKAFPDITVSTYHSYEIHKPHQWKCDNEYCSETFGRHTKKIGQKRNDEETMICGRCNTGEMKYVGSFNNNGTPRKMRTQSAFSVFVKNNFAEVKAVLGSAGSHENIMKELSLRYKVSKAKSLINEQSSEIIDIS